MRKALGVALLLLFAASATHAQNLDRRKEVDLRRAQKLFSNLSRPQSVPVSFVYDGISHRGLGGLKSLSSSVSESSDGKQLTATYALDSIVSITVEASMNTDYGEVEYTLWFENHSESLTSPVLEDVQSVSTSFDGQKPVLRGCLGDHVNQYAAYEHDLLTDTVDFRSDGGRATHVVFPYFDLVHGEGGTLLALGWAGTWQARFTATGRTTRLTAANCNDFRAVLLPGERVRTALVVMIPYKGRNADDASNLWREWFVTCNMPKANAEGDAIKPFTTATFAGDTGLPNSDGSISERHFTWARTLYMINYTHLPVDFRWFDAGWYFDPAGNTVPSNWWGTVGSWELDTLKWPAGTLLESNEACHRSGMKTLVWFEPERVTMVDALVRNYGYRPEWAISNGRGVITNDIGNPDCRLWTLRRITKMMGDNGFDLFREDNNSDPGTTWPLQDRQMSEQIGLPRTGITENKAIQGHYLLWDEIIRFCAENGKCTFIDNCASGGGRNDVESLRRSIPFLRSDSDRTKTGLRLSMTSTFNRWIPYCGASTREAEQELVPGTAGGADTYVARASWLTVFNIADTYTHDPNLDYDKLKHNLAEWRRFSDLLTREMYVLTPWHSKNDLDRWTVLSYRNRHTREAVVTAFRQETSPDSVFTARLPFTRKGETYRVENIDTGEVTLHDGQQLSTEGLRILLPQPKLSAVLHLTLQ